MHRTSGRTTQRAENADELSLLYNRLPPQSAENADEKSLLINRPSPHGAALRKR